MRTLQQRVYEIVSPPKNFQQRDLGWAFDVMIVGLILLSVLALILESVPSLHAAHQRLFEAFEWLSVIIFSLEYLLRLWTITKDPRYAHPLWGRLRWMVSPGALVDLLAILPFYAGLYVQLVDSTRSTIDARFLRLLRFFRLFRLFKIVRYVAALRAISNVFKAKKEELVLSLGFILFILLLVSCGMYYIEKDAEGSQFVSIPATMWWGVATLTTVGYGDIYPVTPLGKFLGGAIAILGIGLFALPTGILAAGTAEELEKSKQSKREARTGTCECCGRPLPEGSETAS
jgi:voltage-gated potassium channel